MLVDKEIKETGLEIWKMSEVDTWIGYSLDEIKEAYTETTGETEFKDIRKVPRSDWDKLQIIDIEDPYRASYTYRNFLLKILVEEPNIAFPFCFATTEY